MDNTNQTLNPTPSPVTIATNALLGQLKARLGDLTRLRLGAAAPADLVDVSARRVGFQVLHDPDGDRMSLFRHDVLALRVRTNILGDGRTIGIGGLLRAKVDARERCFVDAALGVIRTTMPNQGYTLNFEEDGDLFLLHAVVLSAGRARKNENALLAAFIDVERRAKSLRTLLEESVQFQCSIKLN